jgi:hypothetical protein
MKTNHIPLIVGIGGIILGLMTMIGDWAPKVSKLDTSPAIDPMEVTYSEKVAEFQQIFDLKATEEQDAIATVSAAESALNTAKNEKQAKTNAKCMAQYLLAEQKWAETPAERIDIQEKLKTSMQVAQTCINGQTFQ